MKADAVNYLPMHVQKASFTPVKFCALTDS